jgi:glutathione S-transferase
MKLETWLRIADIPYELDQFAFASTPPPKGKIPYIIEDNGLIMGDSTLIIEHLKRTRQIDPDQSLTPTEHAIGVAFRRMLDEDLYWVAIYTRFQTDAGWEVYRTLIEEGARTFCKSIGQPVPDGMVDDTRKNFLNQLHMQGMGRHSFEEVNWIGSVDLIAVSDFLGDKAFFFGDKPTGVDATIYAHVAGIIDVPINTPCARVGRQRKNLVDYCRRMRERFFSDLPRSEQYDRACS